MNNTVECDFFFIHFTEYSIRDVLVASLTLREHAYWAIWKFHFV